MRMLRLPLALIAILVMLVPSSIGATAAADQDDPKGLTLERLIEIKETYQTRLGQVEADLKSAQADLDDLQEDLETFYKRWWYGADETKRKIASAEATLAKLKADLDRYDDLVGLYRDEEIERDLGSATGGESPVSKPSSGKGPEQRLREFGIDEMPPVASDITYRLFCRYIDHKRGGDGYARPGRNADTVEGIPDAIDSFENQCRPKWHTYTQLTIQANREGVDEPVWEREGTIQKLAEPAE